MSDEKISALLSDDRYDSKDWRQADLAGRIEWLIFMLKAKGEEVENMVQFVVSNSTIANETADRIEELEAKLERISEEWASALYGDLDHGVKSLSEAAHLDFHRRFPSVASFGSTLLNIMLEENT